MRNKREAGDEQPRFGRLCDFRKSARPTSRRLRPFEQHRDCRRTRAADAHESVLSLPPGELVRERGNDSCTRGRKRVAHGDGTPKRIDLLSGDFSDCVFLPPFFQRTKIGKDLTTKRFVHFDDFNVIDRQLIPF